MTKFKNLLIPIWLIIALISIFSYASRTQAVSPNFTLTYVGQPGPLFNETNMAPLSSINKKITVTNNTDNTQKFGLNLQNLIGTPDTKLADVLTMDILRGGATIYSSHISNLKDTEIFLENIPAHQSYIYDIKVTMDNVGNEYQGKEVKFDFSFGWISSITPQILGASTGPKDIAGAASSASELPHTGADATWSLLGIFSLILISLVYHQFTKL